MQKINLTTTIREAFNDKTFASHLFPLGDNYALNISTGYISSPNAVVTLQHGTDTMYDNDNHIIGRIFTNVDRLLEAIVFTRETFSADNVAEFAENFYKRFTAYNS